MKEDGFPYCIPDKRDLTETELALLTYLLKQVGGVTFDANDLKVVARCGCGECPTILFGKSKDDEPIASSDSRAVMDWSGRAANSGVLRTEIAGVTRQLLGSAQKWSEVS